MKQTTLKNAERGYGLSVGGAVVISFAVCSIVAVLACGVSGLPFIAVFAGAVAVLALYQLLSARMYFRLLRNERSEMVRYYMIHFLMRFVLAGVILVVSRALASADATALTWSFMVVFLALLLSEAVVFINIEKNYGNE